MNVILTFKKLKEFNDSSQKAIDKIQFVQIPEIRVLSTVIEVDGKEFIEYTIPYQANVTKDEFNTLKSMLESFGEVYIVGKWDDDGSKIECDANKYKTLLKDVYVNGEYKTPTLAQSKKIQVNTFDKQFIREL